MPSGAHDGRAADPHSRSAVADPHGRSVAAINDVENGVVHLTVRGDWNAALRQEATRWLQKAFAERPAAVLVDLVGLRDPAASSRPTWLNARRTGARLEPPVDVAVCVPPGELSDSLDRMGAGRSLPTFPTLAQAQAAVLERRVLTDRVLLRGAARTGSLAAARRLIIGACTAWGVPELCEDAALVVSELVANAVEHAGTPLVVLASRRSDGVHIAVCDQDPRMPVVPEHDDAVHLRGRGLLLVEAVSSGWGAMPTAGGKVVWATLRRP